MDTPFEVTLKNYRCFEDRQPISVSLGRGFTALVGPNNSGKSTFLRVFYELRELFGRIGPNGNTHQLLNGVGETVNFKDVYDPAELACDLNDRPVSIDLRFAHHGQSGLGTGLFRVQTDRSDVQRWKMSVPGVDPASGFQVLSAGIAAAGQTIVASARLFEAANAIANSLYIGPFRNALNEGAGSYYDLSIGTQFIQVWKEWKTGQSKEKNRVIEQVTEDIRRIFDFRRLEINAADQINTLQLTVDGRPYKLRELGAGLTQFIVTFANAAIRRPRMIFIDEPELNLHPSLQIDFITSLAAYAQDGMVFATHNLGLARAVADRVYSLQRDGSSAVVCRPLEATPSYAEFVGEMSFGSYHALGFDRILLVEGVTEVKTIQQFLRMLRKDHQVLLLPLGGAQLINGRVAVELAELRRISPRISVLVDSERDAAGSSPPADRVEFAAECTKLGFNVHLTDRRATEHYLTAGAIQRLKGAKYAALDPYARLRDVPMPWSKDENWRIAREMTWSDLETTDVGAFLKRL